MTLAHSKQKSCSFSIYPIWKKNDDIETSFLPPGIREKVIKDLPYMETLLKSKKYSGTDEEAVVVYLGKLAGLNEDIIRKYLSACMGHIKANLAHSSDIFLFPGMWDMAPERCFFMGCESLLLSNYSYTDLKSKKPVQFDPSQINLVIPGEVAEAEGLAEKAEIIKEAVFLARDLINGPANLVTIEYIEQKAIELSAEKKITCTVFNEEELKKMNMNLHLAVGRSSSQSPSLVELKYHHSDDAPTVCLVAKGVVFDSGGLDLKPALSMDTMKDDMGGAAVALGVVKAAAELNLEANITALIPLAENSIGGNSFRAGDVITGHKGISVEIKNTDAEGRLMLADALSYSDSFNPHLTISIATLTGGAVSALGTKITPVFFSDKDRAPGFFASAAETGEPVWELPLFDEYRDMLKSDTGDMCNLGSPVRQATTIISALFLSKFVDNKKWIHLDIAGPTFLDKKWHIFPKGGTGIMVRTLVHYLENFK